MEEKAERWRRLKDYIETIRKEKEGKVIPGEFSLGLSEPITIKRTAFYRDGGTLGVFLEGSEGERAIFSLDQRGSLDYKNENSYVYVGGVHPNKEEASQVDWGGETESELLKLLRKAEPAKDASEKVAERFIQKLEERTGEPASCYVAGCSGEVCSSQQDVITTCEYIPGTECLDKADCKAMDGECKWILTDETAECLQEKDAETEENLKDSRIGELFERAEER